MGRLIASARRKGYRQYWATRYWYMDTQSGREARIATACIASLVVIMQCVRLAMAVSNPPQEQHAVAWWVVQLIIAVISAIISYATMPKVEPPKPNEGDAPTVEDGRAVLEVHGEYWIEDEFILANKVVGRVPIKSGGKK